MKAQAEARSHALEVSHKLHQYNHDVDEAIRWIAAKELVLSSAEYGGDMTSVNSLLTAHADTSRELDTLSEKVNNNLQ